MTSYSKLHSDFWIKYSNTKVIGAGAYCQSMALYLQSNPHSNMFGAYHLPLLYMVSDLKLSVKRVESTLAKLCAINYCKYDYVTKYIWVCDLVSQQIGEIDTDTKDNRITGFQKIWDSLPPEFEFLENIHQKYGSGLKLNPRISIKLPKPEIKAKQKLINKTNKETIAVVTKETPTEEVIPKTASPQTELAVFALPSSDALKDDQALKSKNLKSIFDAEIPFCNFTATDVLTSLAIKKEAVLPTLMGFPITPFEAPSDPLQSPLEGALEPLRSNIEDRSKNIEERNKKEKEYGTYGGTQDMNPNSHIVAQARRFSVENIINKNFSSENAQRIPLAPSSSDLSIITNKNQTHKPKPAVNDADVMAVFEYWKQIMNCPNAKFDFGRKRLIRRSLYEYGIGDTRLAILGAFRTPFNNGDNPQKQRFIDLSLILRDADHIERYINNCRSPPKSSSKVNQRLDNIRGWFGLKHIECNIMESKRA